MDNIVHSYDDSSTSCPPLHLCCTTIHPQIDRDKEGDHYDDSGTVGYSISFLLCTGQQCFFNLHPIACKLCSNSYWSTIECVDRNDVLWVILCAYHHICCLPASQDHTLKAYICEQHQCNRDRKNLSRSQRLTELLIEQVKPAIAIFVLGGVDAAFNLLFGIILLYTHAFTSPIG